MTEKRKTQTGYTFWLAYSRQFADKRMRSKKEAANAILGLLNNFLAKAKISQIIALPNKTDTNLAAQGLNPKILTEPAIK